MSLRLKAPLAAAAAVSALALAAPAHADAFYLQAQTAKASGRAFSGEGADTGAASLWWNPAAIAGIANGEVNVNATLILPSGEVVDNGSVIVRPGQPPAAIPGNRIAKDPINKGVLPSMSIAYPLGDRVAIGLAVTSPFSFTTDYDADSSLRYEADKTRLLTLDIQPSIGVVVTPWLRVGAGLNIEYTDATLSNALPNLSPALADGLQNLDGDGWDFGWTAGAQLHNEFVTVGVTYKSGIRHTLKGVLQVSGLQGPLAAQNRELNDVTAGFNTPSQWIVGMRVNATDRLTLNTQYVKFGWSKFDSIDLGTPVNSAIPENYRDSDSLAVGLDYDLGKATFRTGIQRATTPTQNGQRDARVPDSDRWTYALGGSYQLTNGLALDAAASYVDIDDAIVNRVTAAYAGTPAQTPILPNATLQNANAVVLSLGGRLTF